MSKRKPDKTSKRVRTPAVVTRTHEQKQEIVRNAKDDLLRSVAVGPIEPPPELYDDTQEEALNVEKQRAPGVEKQAAHNVESQEAPQEDPKGEGQEGSVATNPVQHCPGQMQGFGLASAIGNMVSYQMTLLAMTQANMRFAFDFSQKLLTVRPPFQLADLIVELTKRQVEMVKQSTEVTARTRG